MPAALGRFRSWATLFLGSAAATLAEAWDRRSADEAFASVVTEVSRARFCIAAIGDDARDLRREAAVLLAAAYWRRGRFGDEALWRDLSLDFDRDELDHIKAEAIALPVHPPSPSPFRTGHADPLVREREAALCI